MQSSTPNHVHLPLSNPTLPHQTMNAVQILGQPCWLCESFSVLEAIFWMANVYTHGTSFKPIENVPVVPTAVTAYHDHPAVPGDMFILVSNEI